MLQYLSQFHEKQDLCRQTHNTVYTTQALISTFNGEQNLTIILLQISLQLLPLTCSVGRNGAGHLCCLELGWNHCWSLRTRKEAGEGKMTEEAHD
jgi:hypothetical protein